MRVLDDQECMRLLGSVRLGRIALTSRALPVILPVTFAIMGGDLVFRVGPGAILKAADMQQVVCFEADWADQDLAAAWSVTAIGKLSTLSDPMDIERASQLELVAWTGVSHALVCLRPQLLSGRSR